MSTIQDIERKLGLVRGSYRRFIGPALFAAGNKVQVDAQISITEGAVSGENHVPSRPGEPPNNDTGVLANNIETVSVSPLKVEVSSNAPYSQKLEFGGHNSNGSFVAARPFMAPAANKNRKRAQRFVQAALRAAIRASMRG